MDWGRQGTLSGFPKLETLCYTIGMQMLDSPFLGMDPFLEEPSAWRGVHIELIVTIRNLIRDVLPAQFAIKIEGSVQILDQDEALAGRITPDLYLSSRSPIREPLLTTEKIATPTMVAPFLDEPLENRWLEIVDRRRRVIVTTIELLSPYNKIGVGFEQFMKKRRLVMGTEANWVEIDLLRGGKRPFDVINGQTMDYYALMKRAGQMELSLWSMALRNPLLTIGVPLTQDYDDVPLDLQLAIDTVYREGQYRLDIDYSIPIPPPKLSPENRVWAEKMLESVK